MKHRRLLPFPELPVIFTALLCLTARLGAITPNEWRRTQAVDVAAAGLISLDLPPETLDAARPALEDLRLLDSSGKEIPYLLDLPVPQAGSAVRAKEFTLTIDNGTSTIAIKTGTALPISSVVLETPGAEFIKAVRVEASHDGKDWQELSAGQPVFRLPRGAEKLGIAVGGAWEFLRLTIADDRTQPVPFTGAQLRTAGATAPSISVQASIKSRDESPGVTRLAIDLGAANLPVASLSVVTPEPLFTRNVTVAIPEVTDGGIREQQAGNAVIFRVNIDGKNAARLDIPLEKTIPSRELLLIIHNEDNPPLAINEVRAERRLTRLLFFANEPGRYILLAGNSQCAAPRYDLPAMRTELKSAAATELKPAALADNPDYKTPEALASLTLAGANIDTAGWKFRKPVQLTRAGVQQLELDPETLAHAARDQRDLRVLRDGQQLPFLVERPSISRDIALNASPAIDPKRPALSRLSFKLPRTGIPFSRLACTSPSPLFQRDFRMWEEITDERGNKYPRELGRATWQQTPGHARHDFVIAFDQEPVGDAFFLETDNGDNPAIELRDFRAYYPVTRIIFKATPDASKPVWIYYGNPDASAPRYDLNLVGHELLRAEKSTALTGAEEPAGTAAAKAVHEEPADRGGFLFWGALALVVAVLLAFISRLLPKTGENEKDSTGKP